MERRIKLRSLNSHITCKICSGYLIDATTVTECLHTFCKSCLVKHLEETNTCPACDIVIHQSHPLQYISFDRTMQDIVYKLVPNLQDGEMKREREFYKQRGLPCPKDVAANSEDGDIKKPLEDVHSETGNNRFDEQVTLCLEASSPGVIRSLKKRYLRCPAQATVTHVKKFIARKVMPTMDAYKDVEVLCNDELLGKDHTLKFVLLTRWRFKDPPIRLTYRPRHDILS